MATKNIEGLPVTFLDNGALAVSFPCGGVGHLFPRGLEPVWPGSAERDEVYTYAGRRADGTEVQLRGALKPLEMAMRVLWCDVIAAPPPVAMDEAEVHALALACDRDVKLFTKTLKRLLRERTGETYSVKRGTGTACGWVSVREPGGGGALSPKRLALLTVVLGDRESVFSNWSGLSIRPCGGERVEILCSVAGVGLPPGFKVLPPDWD